MRVIEVYLRQLDDAWEHEWESLLPVLKGLTEEEAAWQAACYRNEPPEEGLPLPGTIHWHVAHLAHCKREYTACIQHRGREGAVHAEPETPGPTFADAVERLRRVHEAQRDVIASLSEEDLKLTVENGMRLDEYLTSTIRHDIWHSAQIAVARRLWRTRA